MNIQPTSMDQPYFKGRFTGIFRPKVRQHEGYFVISELEWNNIRIDDCVKLEDFDVKAHRTGDYWFRQVIRSRPMFPWQKSTDIFIPLGEDRYYAENLYNVLIRKFDINRDKTYFLTNGWHEASGEIFFQLERKPEKSVEKKENATEPATINNTSGTNVISDPIIRSPSETNLKDYSGDPISNNPLNADRAIIDAQTVNSGTGIWANRIRTLLTWLFLILVWFYLWSKFKWIAILLAVIMVVYAIKSLHNRYPLVRSFFRLVIWSAIIYFFYDAVVKNDRGSNPIRKREGNIRISPPKRDDKGRKAGEIDYSMEKEIEWFDFSDLSYLARYKTSQLGFESSVEGQRALKEGIVDFSTSQEFYTRFYAGLWRMDRDKVKTVAKIFSDSAVRKRLGPLETAEMVVAFVQEIPYYLVHDGTCQEASATGNDFITEYHRNRKPCLANVDAGVQSPYEFLHNLKGDCDTRSLLAHAILRELNIASSVWVSETYGHSILGVAVPVGHGIYKEIQGIRHYGVELTAKGYRLGMVSSEHAEPRNWQITLYNNHQ